ncbi:MAG: RrF2 family transcriptional regulator [Planctomycetota bacterium]|jgi:Rrf2 family protein
MNVLRQNTDYAIRVMANMANRYNKEPVSARVLSKQEDISYQFACKILQQLNKAGLVTSSMGPKGGFQLSSPPSRINLLEIIGAIQGPLSLNRCLIGPDACPRQIDCSVTGKLKELQIYIDSYLRKITLEELLHEKRSKVKRQTLKAKRGA